MTTVNGSETAADGPVPQSGSAETVGNQFVSQYYTVLHASPKHVHRFYSDRSTQTYAEVQPDGAAPAQDVKTITGQKTIHAEVMSRHYEDSLTEIYSVDSQYSVDGGVIVTATGAMQAKDKKAPKRPFVQTFFLAVQEKGYFVLNDIFRFLTPVQTASQHTSAVTAQSVSLDITSTSPSEGGAQQQSQRSNGVTIMPYTATPLAAYGGETTSPGATASGPVPMISIQQPPPSTTTRSPARSGSLTSGTTPTIPPPPPPHAGTTPSSSEKPPADEGGGSVGSSAPASVGLSSGHVSPAREPTTPAGRVAARGGTSTANGGTTTTTNGVVVDLGEFPPSSGVFIRDIPPQVTLDELTNKLAAFGALTASGPSLKLQKGRDSYAFADFESIKCAQECVASGIEFDGKHVPVVFKRPEVFRKNSSTGGNNNGGRPQPPQIPPPAAVSHGGVHHQQQYRGGPPSQAQQQYRNTGNGSSSGRNTQMQPPPPRGMPPMTHHQAYALPQGYATAPMMVPMPMAGMAIPMTMSSMAAMQQQAAVAAAMGRGPQIQMHDGYVQQQQVHRGMSSRGQRVPPPPAMR